jgi:hypothetical protein
VRFLLLVDPIHEAGRWPAMTLRMTNPGLRFALPWAGMKQAFDLLWAGAKHIQKAGLCSFIPPGPPAA